MGHNCGGLPNKVHIWARNSPLSPFFPSEAATAATSIKRGRRPLARFPFPFRSSASSSSSSSSPSALPVAAMAARGSKKRKLAEEDPGIIGAGRPPSPPSGSRGSADRRLGVVVVADPDSDQGSCDSLLSDATTRLTQDDAAEAASRLLIAVVVRSPEALLAFVQRLTPEAVFRAIDWDLVPSGEARKVLPPIYIINRFDFFISHFSF